MAATTQRRWLLQRQPKAPKEAEEPWRDEGTKENAENAENAQAASCSSVSQINRAENLDSTYWCSYSTPAAQKEATPAA